MNNYIKKKFNFVDDFFKEHDHENIKEKEKKKKKKKFIILNIIS